MKTSSFFLGEGSFFGVEFYVTRLVLASCPLAEIEYQEGYPRLNSTLKTILNLSPVVSIPVSHHHDTQRPFHHGHPRCFRRREPLSRPSRSLIFVLTLRRTENSGRLGHIDNDAYCRDQLPRLRLIWLVRRMIAKD